MRHRLIVVPTLLAFVLLTLRAGRTFADEPPAPTAQPPAEDPALAQARAHFEAGRNAYLAANYEQAIREFRSAEAIRPSPVLEYNIGLAYEGLGRPRVALRHYRKYLADKPDAQNRPEVEQRIAALEKAVAAGPATPEPAAQPAPPTTPAEGAPTQPPPEVQPPQGEAQAQPPGPAEGTQPQYQYPPGYDPYGGYVAPRPYAPPKKRKSSMWWIVFPIVGGVALTAGLIYFAWWAANQTTSPTYYESGSRALSVPQDSGGSRALSVPQGAVFNF
jgi:tetratricopeptide (TPR) repeat protein